MSEYPEDKPFGEWTAEQQREFKIDVLVDGKAYQVFYKGNGYSEWSDDRAGLSFEGNPKHVYRLAPEPQIPDSIDWSHVHPDYVKMVRHADAVYVFLYGTSSDKEIVGFAQDFAYYKRGNMEACTVYRPGFEPEGGEVMNWRVPAITSIVILAFLFGWACVAQSYALSCRHIGGFYYFDEVYTCVLKEAK